MELESQERWVRQHEKDEKFPKYGLFHSALARHSERTAHSYSIETLRAGDRFSTRGDTPAAKQVMVERAGSSSRRSWPGKKLARADVADQGRRTDHFKLRRGGKGQGTSPSTGGAPTKTKNNPCQESGGPRAV